MNNLPVVPNSGLGTPNSGLGQNIPDTNPKREPKKGFFWILMQKMKILFKNLNSTVKGRVILIFSLINDRNFFKIYFIFNLILLGGFIFILYLKDGDKDFLVLMVLKAIADILGAILGVITGFVKNSFNYCEPDSDGDIEMSDAKNEKTFAQKNDLLFRKAKM